MSQVSTEATDRQAPNIPALTAALARSEEAAWRAFFDLYYHRLLRYLLVAAHGNEDQARDALQSTFIRAARHVRAFESEEAFWRWLTVLARSALVDEQRKSNRFLRLFTRWFEDEDPPEPAVNHVDHRMEECLDLSVLAPEERDLISRKYFEDQSVRDIAAALEISEKAVESRLTRARARLKQHILERLK